MSEQANLDRAQQPGEAAHEEDPLVELARIVSGGNTFEDAMAPAPANETYNPDLENELMQQLHGDAVADPHAGYAEPAYDNDGYLNEAPPAEYVDSGYVDDPAGVFVDPNAGVEPYYEAPLAAEQAPSEQYHQDSYAEAQYDPPAHEAGYAEAEYDAPAIVEGDFAPDGQQMDFDAAFQAELDNTDGFAEPVSGDPNAQLPPLDTQFEIEQPIPQQPEALAPVFEPNPMEQPMGGFDPVMEAGGLPPETTYDPPYEPIPEANDLGAYMPDQFAEAGIAAPDGSVFADAPQPVAPAMEPELAPVAVPVGAAAAAANDDEEGGRSKFILMAAFGGLLLLGGVAVYAFNSGSGTITSPQQVALIEADADPIKIKPEDPGGLTIPNQDKAVYERVNNGPEFAAAPQQENLVSGAETPVSLERPVNKSEDRLGEESNNTSIGGNSLLAPKKVRTVVVKPDGTIVAVKDPAPKTQVAALNTGDPVEANPSASGADTIKKVVEVAQPTAAAPASNTFEGGTAATGVLPLPKSAPGDLQINKPIEVVKVKFNPPAAKPKVAATPKATSNAPLKLATPSQTASTSQPATTTASSGGGYVVQVSSQRSADAARASFANIQRRYTAVLGGRSANIQKANIAGKGTYYRVRVAAGSRSNAISLCERLKSVGGSCFVTR